MFPNHPLSPSSMLPRHCRDHGPVTDLNTAAAECRMVVCGAVEGLLAKTGLSAQDIDIVVTT